MRNDSANDAALLAALEASAADLSQIEALVGGFNIFHALRVSRTEIRHSNFLSWLIDPLESHMGVLRSW
jgi:hypothetical protein